MLVGFRLASSSFSFVGSCRFLSPGRCGITRIQRLSIATTAKMTMNPPVWTPNFVPVELNDDPAFSESGSFRIVSYNILAQVYVKSALFPHSPSSILKWKTRSQNVLSRILALDADLLCLQELDEFDSFYKAPLESKGYESIYVQRSGNKRDGCGILYKYAWCELLAKESIDFNDLVPGETPENDSKAVDDEDDRDVTDPRIRLRRNCVGILAAFRMSRCPEQVVVIANTHLYWDPALADVKLAQAKYLLYRVRKFEKQTAEAFNCNPLVLVAGDFNSTPGDAVYNYLTSGRRIEDTDSHEFSHWKDLKAPPVPLDSLYATVQGEPPFTNCTPGFTGTLDYIFFGPSKHLRPKAYLELPRPDAPDVLGGLPNHSHPSDHLPIGAAFSIC